MSISLCIIAKNEERNIGRCLESVKDIVDEIILVDTGSTDDTVRIAKEYGAKVYYYEWNDSFADAKNFAIEKATKEWILCMDADDELSSDGKEKILNIVNNDKTTGVYFFKTYSYVGDEENNDIVMNINIRLIRNNRGYKFIGDIHEQILPGPEDMGRLDAMKVGDVIFYHYGYLNEEIKLKDKRNRNIRIISKILEKNPNDNFMLFNMGSEYFALCDFNTALYYYKKAYEKFNPGFGYSSKLILRIAGCYEYLGRFNEELKIIDEGLKYYPHFTDLEFMRAKVYFIQNRFTLAIKSLKKCIKMGDAPFYLGELVGVGTFKAYELLAKIYYELQDYNSALRYAKKAYKLKDNRENFLFLAKIILESQSLSKAEKFLQKEAKKGKKYLILSEAFFEQKMFNKALKYLEKESGEDIEKINFYKGKYLFYSKKLEESRAILIELFAL